MPMPTRRAPQSPPCSPTDVYVRDTDVIVLKPGSRGAEHASERFGLGGSMEQDLLPQGSEIDLYRIVVGPLPDSVVTALPGRRVHEIVTIPPFRGNCPLRGNDRGGDMLNRIADLPATHARVVERGTLIAFAPDPNIERDGCWHTRRKEYTP